MVVQPEGQEGIVAVPVTEADTPEVLGLRGGYGPSVQLTAPGRSRECR